MNTATDMQTRRSMARYERRRAKAVAKGCTCITALDFGVDFLSSMSRMQAARCPFHKDKN